MSNPFLRWFSKNILNIIPIERHVDLAKEDPLLPASKALSQNEVVILYPEGTRGEPERLASFKKGIAYLAQKHPYVPIIPVYIHGLGKALPKGELILVPFFCDVFVGAPMNWTGDINSFMRRITDKMKGLEREGHFPEWI